MKRLYRTEVSMKIIEQSKSQKVKNKSLSLTKLLDNNKKKEVKHGKYKKNIKNENRLKEKIYFLDKQ